MAADIALFSMALTWLGLRLGERFGSSGGAITDGAAGLLLILLGVADGLNWI